MSPAIEMPRQLAKVLLIHNFLCEYHVKTDTIVLSWSLRCIDQHVVSTTDCIETFLHQNQEIVITYKEKSLPLMKDHQLDS